MFGASIGNAYYSPNDMYEEIADYRQHFPNEEITLELEGYTFTVSIDYNTLVDHNNYYQSNLALFQSTAEEANRDAIKYFFAENFIIDDICNNWGILSNVQRVDASDPEIRINDGHTKFIVDRNLSGTKLDTTRTREILRLVITGEVDSKLDLYSEIYDGDCGEEYYAKLQKLCDEANTFVWVNTQTTCDEKTYNFSVVEKYEYMSFDYNTFTYDFDEEKAILDYVNWLARDVSTVGDPVNFNTADERVVSISKGEWGRVLDKSSTLENLQEAVDLGATSYELVWLREASDINAESVFVEVNLTKQKLYLHKDGEIILTSDIVSGNAKNHATPAGIYFLKSKEKNRTLRGYNDDGTKYASFVNYWMPFNGGIGLHDATWRGSFGGTIYKTNGSHGCVNLPKFKAKTIYETVKVGIPVVCYY